MSLKLIFPCEEYLSSYTEAYLEDVKYRSGADEFFCPPDIVIAQAENYRLGKNMQEGYVQSTMLWAICGAEFVGCVDIRHLLTENLLNFGGHIGYEVRYSKWNRGYGTEMLRLALVYAKEQLGISRALVTCDVDNIASAKVIEHCGGVLENILETTDVANGSRHTVKRYWIDIS